MPNAVEKSVFGVGVGDLNACLVLVEVCEGPCPTVSLSYYLAVNFGTVCVQADGDACGSLAVLVVVVFPDLFAGNLYLFDFVSIDYVVAVNLCCVAVNCIFGDGLLDLTASHILIKICEGP